MIAGLIAISENGVIGDSNDLPWYLSADLVRFRKLTTGQTVVMGRKTWQAILARNGKPLPNRTSVVITRDPNFRAEGAIVKHDLKEALAVSKDLFVIGGAQIFNQALPYLERLYLTRVDAQIRGDTTLPALNMAEWKVVSEESYPADEKNEHPYTFLVLDRNHAAPTTA